MKSTYLLFLLTVGLIAFQCKNPSTSDITKGSNLPISISEVSPSPQFPNSSLKSMDYTKGKFKFTIDGDSFKIGAQTIDANQKYCANSDKGQHLHLIVDNKPYDAKYETEFDYPMQDTIHTVLAFLSRSYHESVKDSAAYIAKDVLIKDGSILRSKPILDPVLFYSRPKGSYIGEECKKLLLDFYCVNFSLGEKYSLDVEVNGKKLLNLKEWKPVFLENLPMGDNLIKLTLLDSTGAQAKSRYNPIERKITLQADPLQK